MRRIAVVAGLAVAVGAAGLLVLNRSSGGSADARQYRHYFLKGKRACAAMLKGLGPTPVDGTTVWSGGESVVILHPGRDVPRQYRNAMRAGCDAAAG